MQTDTRAKIVEGAFVQASKAVRGLSPVERVRVVVMLLVRYEQEQLAEQVLASLRRKA